MAVVGRAEAGVAAVLRRVGGLLEGAQDAARSAPRAARDPHARARAPRRVARSPPSAPPPARATCSSAPAASAPRASRAGRRGASRARARGVRARDTGTACRARRAAARPLRWRRSSGARSGGETRSARARAPPRRARRSSKTNSGSEESSVSAPLWPLRRSSLERRRRRARGAPAARAHGSLRALAPGEDLVDLLVAQTLVRADQRAVEGGLRDPRPVQLELDRHRRALLPRHERAGVVRERLAAASARPRPARTRSCRAAWPPDRRASPRAHRR